jgi:hypothetical protein
MMKFATSFPLWIVSLTLGNLANRAVINQGIMLHKGSDKWFGGSSL